MATESRWKHAQTYERAHWRGLSALVKDGQGDLYWYNWSAEQLIKIMAKAFPENPPTFTDSKVLEVGSGPIGIVTYLKAAERYAVDPLCHYFASQPSLVENRNPDVTYLMSRGEELEFRDSYFDLVIIENVIDHVLNADTVMNEIHRVLKPGGILYLSVNLHPTWGAFLHKIISRLRIDKGHPHTFTVPRIRTFLANHRFDVKHDDWQNYNKCRKEDMAANSFRAKLKGFSGLSEFAYRSVSIKTP